MSLWSALRRRYAPAAGPTSLGFALALLHHLTDTDDNLICSPWSLQTVFAMLQPGARGVTEAALRRVPKPATLISPHIRSANSVWIHDAVTLLPGFIQAVSDGCAASLERLPTSDPSAAINQWVAHRSENRITHLLDALSPETRMVLVSAIALNARWSTPFEKTAPGDFVLGDGAAVVVTMMHDTRTVPYVESPDWQAIELSYRKSPLAMLLILPDANMRLAQFERALTESRLAELISALRNRHVVLEIPRFAFRTRVSDLTAPLTGMALGEVVSRRADFSGIDGTPAGSAEALVVEVLVQEATIEVDEGGTVATAATGGLMDECAASEHTPKVLAFRADRPFLFLIRDRDSDDVIFVGRVTDPSERVDHSCPFDIPVFRKRVR